MILRVTMFELHGYKIAGRMPVFKPWQRQAIRDRRKTETRRVIKPQPPTGYVFVGRDTGINYHWRGYSGFSGANLTVKCPYGKPGDVRVMPEPLINQDGRAYYLDDLKPVFECGDDVAWIWKRDTLSSLFMPVWAGRTIVRYTDLRAEHLRDITEEGALAEGAMHVTPSAILHKFDANPERGYRAGFMNLWNSINAQRGYPWINNDWVWVIKWEVLRV
jgi:hypothetical protein